MIPAVTIESAEGWRVLHSSTPERRAAVAALKMRWGVYVEGMVVGRYWSLGAAEHAAEVYRRLVASPRVDTVVSVRHREVASHA